MTRIVFAVLCSASMAVVFGCGSSGGGGAALCPGTCLAIEGTYQLTGNCPPSSCTFTQTGCSLSVSCDDGTSATGTSGDTVTFQNGGVSCTARLQGGSFSGSCTLPEAQTCNFGVQPTEPIKCTDGSTPGMHSTNAPNALPCTQKADSDTDGDCASFVGKPRKLDCDASQTATAEAKGCVRTDPTDSDVCCPITVSGQTEGGGGGGTIPCTLASDAFADSDCLATTGTQVKFDCIDTADQQAAMTKGCVAEDPSDVTDFDVCCPDGVVGSSGGGGGVSGGGTSGASGGGSSGISGGGSGGSGGSGGIGSAGSSGGGSGGVGSECQTCAEAITEPDLNNANPCAGDSAVLFEAVQTCACFGACASSCTDTCSTGFQDTSCTSCVASGCSSEQSACLAD